MPSDHEGFGLAVLEALACDVPVLATPVGIHPVALDGIAGTLCAPFDLDAWSAALRARISTPPNRGSRAAPGPRCGRPSAWPKRVLDAWIEVSGAPLYSRTEAPNDGAVSI